MITILKLAGLSAILSAGLVTGFEASAARTSAPLTAKVYLDRLPESGAGAGARIVIAYADPSRPIVSNTAAKSDRLRVSPEAVNPDRRIASTTTTTETRTGDAGSVLIRVPATLTASR